MEFPERFNNLPQYAFPRLRALLDPIKAGGSVISMSLGEPQHPYPAFVDTVLAQNTASFNRYPDNNGNDALLDAIERWLMRRYGVKIDAATQVLSLNGTREGLFNTLMALIPETKNAKRSSVLIPNPFYQVYAVGTLGAQAEPIYLNTTAQNGFLPDFSTLTAKDWARCAAVIICSPSNPQGAVADAHYWRNLIELAQKHDFLVFADECYSEIYRDTPPISALEVAQDMGADFDRVVIFHSLSKRSNLPGLRSGFAVSGARNIAAMRKLRAYAGAPLPSPLQAVATAVWNDETHVDENRHLYREKYAIADTILGDVAGYFPPQGGFFLWLPVENDESAALKLWQETGVRALPGSYLSRSINGQNPGENYLRVAMVAPKSEVETGLNHIKRCLYR